MTHAGGRPYGSGAHFLRYETQGRRNVLHIGRALWQQLGQPRRMIVQRLAGRLRLSPCGAGEGYAVTRTPNGMPRISFGAEMAESLALEERRYPAEIVAGAIVAEEGI